MPRLSRAAIATAAAALTVTVLSACAPSLPGTSSADGQPAAASLEREPGPAQKPSIFGAEGLQLPLQFAGSQLIDTGWVVPPQHLEGIFFAPVETGNHLTFTAYDSDGTALWSVERPLACAGFWLGLTDSGQPLAVVNDSGASSDGFSAFTATAYDLRSGDQAWGPVEVPGPHQGPGLVYAEPAAAMGETGPRLALDVNTGEVAAGGPDQVVAERDGLVLLQTGDRLRATTSQGDTVWETALPEGIERAASRPGSPLKDGLIELVMADDRSVVIDLDTGDIVAANVTSAALDATAGVLVATDGSRTWAVDTADGEQLWEQPSTPEARVWAAGTAQVYIRDGDAVRVHNALTGMATPGYDEPTPGAMAVPRTISGTGAAAIAHDGGMFLATTPILD